MESAHALGMRSGGCRDIQTRAFILEWAASADEVIRLSKPDPWFADKQSHEASARIDQENATNERWRRASWAQAVRQTKRTGVSGCRRHSFREFIAIRCAGDSSTRSQNDDGFRKGT